MRLLTLVTFVAVLGNLALGNDPEEAKPHSTLDGSGPQSRPGRSRSLNPLAPGSRGSLAPPDEEPQRPVLPPSESQKRERDILNARIVVVCEPANGVAHYDKFKKPGDVVLAKRLVAALPRGAAVAGPKNAEGFVELIQELDRVRDIFKVRTGGAGDKEFSGLKARLQDLRGAHENEDENKNKKNKKSDCTEEDVLAVEVLSSLPANKNNKVFVEANCDRWNQSLVLKQLIEPYPHVFIR